MFQKDLLPSFSGRRARSSKMFVLSCQLNSFTFRKTIILHVFHLINTKSTSPSLYKNFFFTLFLEVWGTGIYKNPYLTGPVYSFIHRMHWDLALPYSSCYSLIAFSQGSYQAIKILTGLTGDTSLDWDLYFKILNFNCNFTLNKISFDIINTKKLHNTGI